MANQYTESTTFVFNTNTSALESLIKKLDEVQDKISLTASQMSRNPFSASMKRVTAGAQAMFQATGDAKRGIKEVEGALLAMNRIASKPMLASKITGVGALNNSVKSIERSVNRLQNARGGRNIITKAVGTPAQLRRQVHVLDQMYYSMRRIFTAYLLIQNVQNVAAVGTKLLDLQQNYRDAQATIGAVTMGMTAGRFSSAETQAYGRAVYGVLEERAATLPVNADTMSGVFNQMMQAQALFKMSTAQRINLAENAAVFGQMWNPIGGAMNAGRDVMQGVTGQFGEKVTPVLRMMLAATGGQEAVRTFKEDLSASKATDEERADFLAKYLGSTVALTDEMRKTLAAQRSTFEYISTVFARDITAPIAAGLEKMQKEINAHATANSTLISNAVRSLAGATVLLVGAIGLHYGVRGIKHLGMDALYAAARSSGIKGVATEGMHGLINNSFMQGAFKRLSALGSRKWVASSPIAHRGANALAARLLNSPFKKQILSFLPKTDGGEVSAPLLRLSGALQPAIAGLAMLSVAALAAGAAMVAGSMAWDWMAGRIGGSASKYSNKKGRRWTTGNKIGDYYKKQVDIAYKHNAGTIWNKESAPVRSWENRNTAFEIGVVDGRNVLWEDTKAAFGGLASAMWSVTTSIGGPLLSGLKHHIQAIFGIEIPPIDDWYPRFLENLHRGSAAIEWAATQFSSYLLDAVYAFMDAVAWLASQFKATRHYADNWNRQKDQIRRDNQGVPVGPLQETALNEKTSWHDFLRQKEKDRAAKIAGAMEGAGDATVTGKEDAEGTNTQLIVNGGINITVKAIQDENPTRVATMLLSGFDELRKGRRGGR